MREYWTDHKGRAWPIIKSRRRLKFSYPSHAAMRAFVFHRDGFRCVRCGASAIDVPDNYDGRYTLWTDTYVKQRPSDRRRGFLKNRDVLVVDHILTLPAGGINHPDNFQTLCETCNKKKQAEDKENTKEALINQSVRELST